MLPKQINPQTLNGIKDNSSLYETAHGQISAFNNLIQHLGPGKDLSGADFTTSINAVTVGGISGTIKRGKFTVKIGNNPGTNVKVIMAFPRGSFLTPPFAQVVRNGGTGQSLFTFSESVTSLVLVISNPTGGEDYSYQFLVSD